MIAMPLRSGEATASSVVCMISVSSYSRSPSARGMPISSAISPDGSRPAMSWTRSHSPRSMTSSTMSRASAAMRSANSCALRGVKPRLTSSLNRSCCGGSMFSIICRCAINPISSGSGTMTPRANELNVLGWRLIVRMSSYLVIAQKPGPSASGCQCTGSLARSQAYCCPRDGRRRTSWSRPGRSAGRCRQWSCGDGTRGPVHEPSAATRRVRP